MAPDKFQTNGGVAAVERALAILAAFDDHAPALTLAELAVRTGLYKSTILRLLVSLQRTGFINQGSDNRYRIGVQAWRVGSNFTLDLEQVLLPTMESLSAETGESVSFYIPVLGTKPPMRMCLLRVDPERRIRDTFHVGNLLPTDKGASGIVIRLFSKPFQKADDPLRAEGAHITWGDIDPEICAISAPVMGPHDLAGALVLSAPSIRHDRQWAESTKNLVIAAAQKMSQNLAPLRNFPFSQIAESYAHRFVQSRPSAFVARRSTQ
jgi:DNA-binding IclR family transcriptional regulator